MDKKQSAVETFHNNFNCSQSVFSVFAEELGLDRETALKIACCFGGGMRCGEVCGAVTGALMAIGLKHGHYKPEDSAAKADAYQKACLFTEQFKQKNKSIICKELLGCDLSLPEGQKAAAEQGLFATICPKMVEDAVEIAQNIIG